MKKNKLGIKILSTVIGVSLIMPNTVLAAGKIHKDETVYVELDSLGHYQNKTSSIWLHSDAPLQKIVDQTTLEDVVNVKGDEEPDFQNGQLTWTTEEKELYYQGNSQKELPFEVQIRYFLEGQEVNPEEIIGESGQLKLEITIENKDVRTVTLTNGEDRNVYTPYLVGTSIILPTNKFQNIELNTGQVLSDATSQIVGFVSLPGLKESLNLTDSSIELADHLELTTDVENFEIPSIAMMAKSELPEMDELEFAEDIDELLNGIDQIVDAGQELTKGTDQLMTGQGELEAGINEFTQGVQKIKAGTNPLSQGSLELKKGMDSAYSASLEMAEGSQALSANSEKLADAYVSLANGTVEFSEKAKELSQGVSQFGKEMENLPAASQQLNNGMNELVQNTEKIQAGQSSLTDGLEESTIAITEIKNGKNQEIAGIQSLQENIQHLESLMSQLEDGESKKEMLRVLEMQKQGLKQMQESSEQLTSGLVKVEDGLNQASSSSAELSAASKKVNQGQQTVAQGFGELAERTKYLPTAIKEFEEAGKSLNQAAGLIKNKSLEAKKAASQFKEGGATLASASGQLSNGLKELSSGSNQLNQGIGELANGANELAAGSLILQNGSQELMDGSKELNDGMQTFYEEGIKKIQEEVDNSDLDLNEILEVKDELVQLSKENDSFSGKSEDMEGDLKFILKTDQLALDEENEEAGEELPADREFENNAGFFNWLKSLFTR